MVCAKVMLRNPLGLHLRPAGRFCTEALKFSAAITIRYEKSEVNAKSVLGVLSIGLRYKSEFELICEGADEVEALQALKTLVEQGLGEKIEEQLLES